MTTSEKKTGIGVGVIIAAIFLLPKGKEMYDDWSLHNQAIKSNQGTISLNTQFSYFSNSTLVESYEHIAAKTPREVPPKQCIIDVVEQFAAMRLAQLPPEPVDWILYKGSAVTLRYNKGKLVALQMHFNHDMLAEGSYYFPYTPGKKLQPVSGASACRDGLSITRKGFLTLKELNTCDKNVISKRYGITELSEFCVALDFNKNRLPIKDPLNIKIGGNVYPAFAFVCGPTKPAP